MERPVEELIGWHRDPQIPEEWCGEHYANPVRAEVDDLAAWLRERQYWGVSIVVGEAYAHGRSIRDALIAAVRKVAAS